MIQCSGPSVAVHLTALRGEVIITVPSGGRSCVRLSALSEDGAGRPQKQSAQNTIFCCLKIRSYTYTWIVKLSKDKTFVCLSNLRGWGSRRGAAGVSGCADCCWFPCVNPLWTISIALNVTRKQREQIYRVSFREEETLFSVADTFLLLKLLRQVYCCWKSTKIYFSSVDVEADPTVTHLYSWRTDLDIHEDIFLQHHCSIRVGSQVKYLLCLFISKCWIMDKYTWIMQK